MKQTKKLESINQKIAELISQKRDVENQLIQSISKHIASLLIKKHATNINLKEFIKRISPIIDELNNDKDR